MNPLSLISLAALLAQEAQAHGYISRPQASYINSYTKTKFDALISETISPAFHGRKWDGSPEENAAQLTQSFALSGYASLKSILDPVVPDCGNSRVDVAAVNVSTLSAMTFQNDEFHEGFISSHHGPCEVWIDSQRVFQGDDCRAQFPDMPASLPVNYSVCAQPECTLTFYWLAVHEPSWQVYKQCVPITLGGI